MANIYRRILNGFIVVCTIVICFISIHVTALASELSVVTDPENVEFFDIVIEDIEEGSSLCEASISGIAINSDTGDRVFGLFEFQNGDTIVLNDETEHIYTVIFTPWDSSQQYLVGDYKLNVISSLFEESKEQLSSANGVVIPYTGIEDNYLYVIVASLVVMLVIMKKPKLRLHSRIRFLIRKKIFPVFTALVTAFSIILSASPIVLADSVEDIAPQSDDETNIQLIFGNQEKYLSCATLEDAIAKVRQENILGLASQFNIFCHNDMWVYAADSEGRVAVGNDIGCDTEWGDLDSEAPSSYGWYKIGNGHYVNDYFSIPFYGTVNLIDQVGGLSLISGGDVYNVNSAVSSQIHSDLIDFDDEFEFLKLRSKQLTTDGKNIPTYFMFDDGSFLDKNALSAKHIIDGVTYLAKEYTGIYYTTDTSGNLLQNNDIVAQAGENYHIADNKYLQSHRVEDKYVVCELMPEDSFKYVVYHSHNGNNCYVAHGFSSTLTEEQPVYIKEALI